MSYPLIGIPVANDQSRRTPRFSLNQAYCRAIVAGGGIPVLIPLDEPSVVARYAGRLDGLLLAGGSDLHPALYGQQAGPETEPADINRDRTELALLDVMLAHDLPVLGICRGHQLLAVAAGGKLTQHLDGSKVDHQGTTWGEDRSALAHTVWLNPHSILARSLNVHGDSPKRDVNSMHHQGFDVPPPALQPTAWAADGLIEAQEYGAGHFILSVQWHPEELMGGGESQIGLFTAFIDAVVLR